jgi:antitoxin (DNA-binding transcriptional repressor) of toxin-antitoxin stability system
VEIGAYEAKTNLSRLLERVERITRTCHGRRTAMLVPIQEKRPPEDMVRVFREFRRGRKLDGAGLRAMVEEGRRL